VSNIARFGDIDLDGHQDLVFNALNTDSADKNSYTLFLKNSDCNKEVVSQIRKTAPDFVATNCRHFVFEDFSESLTAMTGPASHLTAFFDWGEMG